MLRIDISPREFVATLQQNYTCEDLSAFGICERDLEELRTSSWLESDAHLYATIDERKRTITFSRTKLSFPVTRTALEYALERNLPDSAQAADTLFVVESQDSVTVMERLGLHAVSSNGLEALGGNDVKKVFGGDQRGNNGWRYRLMLVDFDIARLVNRTTAAIGEVITRLANAADLYGIDPGRRFDVLRPSADDFRMLERATTFADSALIRGLFNAWVVALQGTYIKNWRTQFDTRAPSYARASAALSNALQLQDVFRRVAVWDALSGLSCGWPDSRSRQIQEGGRRCNRSF